MPPPTTPAAAITPPPASVPRLPTILHHGQPALPQWLPDSSITERTLNSNSWLLLYSYLLEYILQRLDELKDGQHDTVPATSFAATPPHYVVVSMMPPPPPTTPAAITPPPASVPRLPTILHHGQPALPQWLPDSSITERTLNSNSWLLLYSYLLEYIISSIEINFFQRTRIIILLPIIW